jgi:flagellar hook-associated protein 3 FlgL
MTRVSTLAQSTLLTTYTLGTQARIADTQVQLATGQKSQRYSGIAQDVSRLLNLESQRDSAKTYVAGIDTVQTRLKLMIQGLESIEDAAGEMKSLLSTTIYTQAAYDTQLWTQADNTLKHVQDVLNTQDDSGYLFAGARRNAAPVDATYATINAAPPFPVAPAGGPPPLAPAPPLTLAQIDQIAQAYYSGSTTASNLSIRISDGVAPVSYGVTADQEAFKFLIAGLHMVRQANSKFPAAPTSNADIDQAYLQNGLELISKAIDGSPTANYPATIQGLRQIAGQVAATNAVLDATRERHVKFIGYAETAIGDIEQVDTAEAAVKLNSDQLALQASLSTLARLKDITLLNYL